MTPQDQVFSFLNRELSRVVRQRDNARAVAMGLAVVIAAIVVGWWL